MVIMMVTKGAGLGFVHQHYRPGWPTNTIAQV